LDLVFKIALISDHVVQFRRDRPRDRGDLALNKKRKERKKETAAKYTRTAVGLSQRAALTRKTIIVIIVIIMYEQ